MSTMVFLGDFIQCLINVGWDINPNGKVCTCCEQWRRVVRYDINKSKRDGLDSHCKPCVSRRKKVRKQQRQKLERKTEEFESVIIGGLSDDGLERFAEIFGSALREVNDDVETQTTYSS